MSKQKLFIAIHAFGLLVTVVLAVGMTFVMIGCANGDKVSNQDAQILALQQQIVEHRIYATALAAELEAVAANVADLNTTVADLASTVLLLGNQLAAQDAVNVQQQADLAVLHSLLSSAQSALASLQTQLTALSIQETATQTQVNAMLVQLATLMGYTSIVSIVDPCGDAAGKVDEVLLKLSDGTILASFSDNAAGQNTRFGILTNGNYVTTDGSSCHINVNNGVVTW